MQQRIIVNNGKKYLVNVPSWEDDVAAMGNVGTLWMQSTDNNWYTVNLSGSAGSLSLYVNQTSNGYVSPMGQEYGYQLVACDDGLTYQVYLHGISPAVVFTVSQVPYAGTSQPKPYLYLQSITDGNYYTVGLTNIGGVIQPTVNNPPPPPSLDVWETNPDNWEIASEKWELV